MFLLSGPQILLRNCGPLCFLLAGRQVVHEPTGMVPITIAMA